MRGARRPRIEDLPDRRRAPGFSWSAWRRRPSGTSTARCGAASSWCIRRCRTCPAWRPPAPWWRARDLLRASASGCAARGWARAATARGASSSSRPTRRSGVLPEAVPMALGSAFFSPCTSAWVALHEVGRVRGGETVLVTGATSAVGSHRVAARAGRGRPRARRWPTTRSGGACRRASRRSRWRKRARPSAQSADRHGGWNGAAGGVAGRRARRARGAGGLHGRARRSPLDLPS